MQLCLKANGFYASGVLRGWYDDPREDAYQMVWRKELPIEIPVNRVAKYLQERRV
jgi:hypothetical protein